MEILNPPVGPILGLVTRHSARLMCAIKPAEQKSKINCGWLRYKKLNDTWSSPRRFRFNKAFHNTGVIELTQLEQGCCYEYQIAYESSYSEADINDVEGIWQEITIHKFNTRGDGDELNFCFGSCMRNNGQEQVGKTLRQVDELHQSSPLDMMLWLGDQVYNDKYLGLTLNNSAKDAFTELYDDFFGNTYVQKIIPNMPNYMVMDDHEIEDSFTDGATAYANTKFNWFNKDIDRLINGINAFYSYQLSHGPIYDTAPDVNQDGVAFIKGQANNQVPVKHYATVDLGDTGLFLMDTRKERSSNGLISSEQEQALEAFLSSHHRVKLIASSVTFLADNDLAAEKADNWKRAEQQRARILNYIMSKGIKNVVFLSGDVHSHFAASLRYRGEDTSVYQLVSGSIFWPTSFLINSIRWFEKDVQFGKAIHGAEEFSLSNPISCNDNKFYASNGIGHVTISGGELKFKVINKSGEVVIDATLPLDV